MARLIDPTAGAGYPFGSILPSAYVTIIATQLPNAINGGSAAGVGGGGAYTPTAEITIAGSGIGGTVGATGWTLPGTQNIALTSRAIPRSQPLIVLYQTNWTAEAYNLWINAGAAGAADVELTRLAHDQRLDSITVRYRGGAGHGAFPAGKPGTMPAVHVYTVDGDGAVTDIGNASDASADVVTFEAWHDIAVLAMAHTIDLNTYRYVAIISSEAGANYLVGDRFGRVGSIVTYTGYSEP